jgi:hypothetical protein
MDGSNFSLDDTDSLVDEYISEIIDSNDPHLIHKMLEVLDGLYDCECGCRGRRHTRDIHLALSELAQLRPQSNISVVK